MAKNWHEIRDPIHTFIRLDSAERAVVDSAPFQRLRHIHQLALTYLVYPGATHRRFEHSLGVMELAGRVFDVITDGRNIHPDVRGLIPEKDQLAYWRRVLRMAALCHDIGHLPFSHAAEKELLPEGWDHERLGMDIIRGPEMTAVWQSIVPPLNPEHVVKLAVGQKKYRLASFSDWESILSEIIVGDAFGVDRMDYLLRDSYHAGVAYGIFDRYRLIDTLRILPRTDLGSAEPALGLEHGGIHAAEALMLARYFMYQQVYFHPVRRIYDIHLKDFLKAWLPAGRFPTTVDEHLRITDSEITAAIRSAAQGEAEPGHDPASRIVHRRHFKRIYERNSFDLDKTLEPGKAVYAAAVARYGEENVRYDPYSKGGGSYDLPVKMSDDRIVSSMNISDTLNKVLPFAFDFVFVSSKSYDDAVAWLSSERDAVLAAAGENDDESGGTVRPAG